MSVDCGESFVLEKGVKNAKITGVHESLLQEGEKDILYYKDMYIGRDHVNLLSSESPVGPISVSIVLSDGIYYCLCRTEKGSEIFQCNEGSVPKAWWRKLFNFPPSPENILSSLPSEFPIQHLKRCKDPNISNELLAMEERQVIRSYKFGLLYCKKGQTTEAEMLQNNEEDASNEYKEFLNFLGERIELNGWKGYRAGLDVQLNYTGTHSIYTKWQGYEVMLHVSTLLPFSKSEKQQLERKRHIGNDIVVMMFQDGAEEIKLESVDSKQNHVFVIVRPHEDGYKIAVARKDGVPTFTPDLNEECFIKKDSVSRDFLYHKLVNGERAAYKAPSFAPKIARTRNVLLREVCQRFSM